MSNIFSTEVSDEILNYLNTNENANVSDIKNHLYAIFEFDTGDIDKPIFEHLQSLAEVKMATLNEDGNVKFNKVSVITDAVAQGFRAYQLKNLADVEIQQVAMTKSGKKQVEDEMIASSSAQQVASSRKRATRKSAMLTSQSRLRSGDKEEMSIMGKSTGRKGTNTPRKTARKATPKRRTTRSKSKSQSKSHTPSKRRKSQSHRRSRAVQRC